MNVSSRMSAAIEARSHQYGEPPKLFKAPARVNIIGEHTDYNDGLVLPTTTSLHTWLCVSPRDDRQVEVRSNNLWDTQRFDLDEISPGKRASWIEYVKGVAAELMAEDVELRGANILIDSDIPLGAGLSSSASLELAVAAAMLDLAGASVPAPQLAEICQRAEHRYAGVLCGIMDQYAIACAAKGNAILLDCRSLDATQMPIPTEVGFIITDSGVRHRLPDGDYNNRRDECAAAVRILAKSIPQVSTLRDADMQNIEDNSKGLGDLLFRRCRHVVTENQRVSRAFDALNAGDIAELGALVNACHASLRDDYEISCHEVEALVASANTCHGVFGSRLIGGGFGGCVLSVVESNNLQGAANELRSRYGSILGKEPWVHVVEAADPVRKVEVT